MTAMGSAGVSGTINTGLATSDIALSLAHLPDDLRSAGLTLEPQCGQTTNLSTFLIQGRGATPEGPRSWEIELGL
jgi:hypothetical protein